MIKAVFFDFVGTLIKKAGENVTHRNIVREVLKRAGRDDLDVTTIWREYEEESASRFRELAGREYVRIRDIDTDAIKRVAARHGFKVTDDFWRISLDMHARYGELSPGAVETLRELRTMGLHIGIITDSDNDYIEAHLNALGIRELFDSVTTSEDAGFYKPHERPFRLALKRAGVEASDAIYVGDNPAKDCVGARKVGMTAVLLDPDSSKRNLWENCDLVISSLRDTVEIVKRL